MRKAAANAAVANTATTTPEFISMTQAGRIIGVTQSTVRNYMHRGFLKGFERGWPFSGSVAQAG